MSHSIQWQSLWRLPLLALVLVLATVSMWRARRDRSPRTEA